MTFLSLNFVFINIVETHVYDLNKRIGVKNQTSTMKRYIGQNLTKSCSSYQSLRNVINSATRM